MSKQTISFNAHHSPIGAFAGFTLGYPGKKGGLGLELTGPADQNVYIGLESKVGNRFDALPFFEMQESRRQDYDVEKTETPPSGEVIIDPCDLDRVERTMNVAADTWKMGDLTFTIYSPVRAIPDPAAGICEELKRVITPGVLCEMSIDNRGHSTSRKAFFGYSGSDPYSNLRTIESEKGDIVGIGQGLHTAVLTNASGIRCDLGFTMEEIILRSDKGGRSFGLGETGGILFEAGPGEVKKVLLAVCFYRGGRATAGLNTAYYYTKFYDCIEEVGRYVLENADVYKKWAGEADEMIAAAQNLSDEQRFMLSHAVRSYYGSTQLLIQDDKPLWIVNEGEYRMMNTFDLAVDQLFFEMKMNPWTVRNLLELYFKRYSYYDTVRFPNREEEFPGGISFTHDMGVGNVFSSSGRSAYELGGLDGCFSHMTHEQLVNWILCASTYYEKTGDKQWLNLYITTFRECLISMVNRDNPQEALRNGLMSLDSSRTEHGCEITTYDSLDTSLGQARNNLYLAVKCWAAYLALAKVFEHFDDKALADTAMQQAKRCAFTIESSVNEKGCLPAIIGEKNDAEIIPAVEGLVFPYLGKNFDMISENGPFGSFIQTLKRHLETVLVQGRCLFDDGGWKLSSTSDNSWLSKIYLCQFVARKVLGAQINNELGDADKVHVKWLLDQENAYYAWSDQMVAGKARGSKYYPRGVTAILWLDE